MKVRQASSGPLFQSVGFDKWSSSVPAGAAVGATYSQFFGNGNSIEINAPPDGGRIIGIFWTGTLTTGAALPPGTVVRTRLRYAPPGEAIQDTDIFYDWSSDDTDPSGVFIPYDFELEPGSYYAPKSTLISGALSAAFSAYTHVCVAVPGEEVDEVPDLIKAGASGPKVSLCGQLCWAGTLTSASVLGVYENMGINVGSFTSTPFKIKPPEGGAVLTGILWQGALTNFSSLDVGQSVTAQLQYAEDGVNYDEVLSEFTWFPGDNVLEPSEGVWVELTKTIAPESRYRVVQALFGVLIVGKTFRNIANVYWQATSQ